MNTFLRGLGFSIYEAKRLSETYGNMALDMLGTVEGRSEMSKLIEKDSVVAAHMEFTRICSGKNVYRSLEPFGVPAEVIYGFFCACGGDSILNSEAEDTALKALREDPFILVSDYNAPFSAVYEAANVSGWTIDRARMTEAAVLSTLSLAEGGSEELGHDDFSLQIGELAGSTCLPLGTLISLSEKLLGDEISTDDILSAIRHLHFRKKILLTQKAGATFAFRESTGLIEFEAATLIKERVRLSETSPVRLKGNPFEAIDKAQAALGLYLSYEQADAVIMALKNRISVITGGPGTGKTQTEKILLEAYRRLSGGAPVTLVAPTGQAAKRMTASTGYPASTIHLALGIMPGEKDPRKARDLPKGLLVIDEASMLDNELLRMLLVKTPKDATIIFIGDADQLPSIGAGNVLEELTKCVPVATLTKIFRQGGDAADIAYNAARIKTGTTQMIEGERFTFIEEKGSAKIQETICDIYKKESDKGSADDVIVLSPLRRNTLTGVNKLNTALRNAVSDETRFVEYNDTRLYLKDKIVFLRNRSGLVNGDTGVIEDIIGDSVVCRFGEIKLILSGSELSWITPAFAETIHKSQGDEYPVVILVADESHPMSKALVYTAVTRAKAKVIVVGSKAAFERAVENVAAGRCSCLSRIVNA